MSGPLASMKVIDLTRGQQGPYASVMLSDMGADVIKIEDPVTGDGGRSLGRMPNGVSPYFEAHDRNKRSVTLDLKRPEARDVIFRLVRDADVFMENFRPAVTERLGIGYEVLSAVNPRLVYASASAFGRKGPWATRPGLDMVAQAMGGIMMATGPNPPTPVGPPIADQVGAMVLAFGITVALLERERSGRGQHVDVSLLGSQVALQALGITSYMFTGRTPVGSDRLTGRGSPFWNVFPAADGWFAIGVLRLDSWAPICRVLGRDDLASDPRFDTPEKRADNRAELVRTLDNYFRTRPRAHWLDLLAAADIVSGPVNTYADVVEDPQVIANEYVVPQSHPVLGETRVVGVPVRLSRTPGGVRAPAPELGQHTEEVLLQHGYTWEEIGALRESGVTSSRSEAVPANRQL